MLLHEAEDAEDAADPGLAVAAVDRLAERADVGARAGGLREQRQRGGRGARRPILGVDRVVPGRLAAVLAEERARRGIEEADMDAVPLDRDVAAEPARAAGRSRRTRPRRSRRDGPCACRTGSSETARPAAAGAPAAPRRTWRRPGAWWCRGCGCRPSARPSGRGRLAPPSSVSKRRPLSAPCVWAIADSTFPFRSGSAHPTGQRDGAVVREHVAIERVQGGIVDVRRQHALAQDCRESRPARRRPAGEMSPRAARPSAGCST